MLTTTTIATANAVFVFGSNLAGHHGLGAALFAQKHYGAAYGAPWGRQGQSFAIPTRDALLRPLHVDTIGEYVQHFLAEVRKTPETPYFVTRIGCGTAGHADSQIARFFAKAPPNCMLPGVWEHVRGDKSPRVVVSGAATYCERTPAAKFEAGMSRRVAEMKIKRLRVGVMDDDPLLAYTRGWAEKVNVPLVLLSLGGQFTGPSEVAARSHLLAWWGTHAAVCGDGVIQGRFAATAHAERVWVSRLGDRPKRSVSGKTEARAA